MPRNKRSGITARDRLNKLAYQLRSASPDNPGSALNRFENFATELDQTLKKLGTFGERMQRAQQTQQSYMGAPRRMDGETAEYTTAFNYDGSIASITNPRGTKGTVVIRPKDRYKQAYIAMVNNQIVAEASDKSRLAESMASNGYRKVVVYG